jgi:sirohydrochlorin ferrochelatase
MQGILLFSHGSLLCGAGRALDEHAARLRERFSGSPVEIGYLNYSEPTFEQGVERLVELGATTIAIVPYFLVPGYFVTNSLPDKLTPINARFPNIEFVVAEALGADEHLADALIESANHAGPRSDERQDVYAYSTALLVMVHGSPKSSANAPVFEVVEIVRGRGVYPIVEVGFMECNEPSIAESIDRCVEMGAGAIVAVPYFLHLGAHVSDDLPRLLEEGRARHPGVEFRMGEYLGRSHRVTEVLADRAKAALQKA